MFETLLRYGSEEVRAGQEGRPRRHLSEGGHIRGLPLVGQVVVVDRRSVAVDRRSVGRSVVVRRAGPCARDLSTKSSTKRFGTSLLRRGALYQTQHVWYNLLQKHSTSSGLWYSGMKTTVNPTR